MVFDEPPFKAYASNLTPDRETGIGKWTDGADRFARSAEHPPRRRDQPADADRPAHRHLSGADAAAIVAYLRAQAPVKNVVPKSSTGSRCRRTTARRCAA
ncbi:MAG: hypothetical protein U1E86_20500 [Burkholderiaceae bacterium]